MRWQSTWIWGRVLRRIDGFEYYCLFLGGTVCLAMRGSCNSFASTPSTTARWSVWRGWLCRRVDAFTFQCLVNHSKLGLRPFESLYLIISSRRRQHARLLGTRPKLCRSICGELPTRPVGGQSKPFLRLFGRMQFGRILVGSGYNGLFADRSK